MHSEDLQDPKGSLKGIKGAVSATRGGISVLRGWGGGGGCGVQGFGLKVYIELNWVGMRGSYVTWAVSRVL